jgi:hypothetical protein
LNDVEWSEIESDLRECTEMLERIHG